MNRYESAVARYFEAWNAEAPEQQEKSVAAAWALDGSYTDPLADARGHEELAAVIAAVREQFPGFTFVHTGAVDGHHDTARFTWELRAPRGSSDAGDGEAAPVAGSDVITLAGDGRIRSVLGFLDRVPGGASPA
ncbi:nuclear transport factor 2 family protein [Streptomyces albidus (ex Kaewkla and Franco 2022)]|uniref:nuclear transport factor 2 family protein n=1 Tax=Streptomyces albidus (ex Kaewkla and Franco 2022) TaxID=722709 RepID=UPI0015EE4E35|nr:nuclear transport factor 2 family protein [Streptomyces albidus (ex Kaewkla and Franco 2022)]